jgi:hypothetical protein
LKSLLFYRLYVLGLGLAVCALFLYLGADGLAQTYDSQHYLYAAQTFEATGEFCSPTGYHTVWPPLFPILLAIFGSKATQFFALLLNLYLIHRLVWQFVPLGAVVWVAYLQLTHLYTHISFLLIHYFVWSEAWFLVLLLICLLQINKLEQPFSFAVLIFCSNLLCVQRLAGIFLVAGFALWLLWVSSWRKAVLYAILAVFLQALWSVRNALLQDKPDFLVNIFTISWQYSQSNYAQSILGLFVPAQFFGDDTNIFCLFWVLVGLVYLCYRLDKQAPLLVFAFITLVYFAFMFFFRVNIPWSSDRYVSPVMPLLIVIFWQLIKRVATYSQNLSLGKVSKQTGYYLGYGVYALSFLVIAYNFVRTYKNVMLWLAAS